CAVCHLRRPRSLPTRRSSDLGALVTPTIAFGADGPAASAATASALTVTNAVSGLHVTDGAAINLVDVNGDGSVIVGVVQAGSPRSGEHTSELQIQSNPVCWPV